MAWHQRWPSISIWRCSWLWRRHQQLSKAISLQSNGVKSTGGNGVNGISLWRSGVAAAASG